MQDSDGRVNELQAVVREHGPAVFSLAARVLNDRCAAEEIAQDVFVTLWRTAPAFESAEHRRRWLLRAAIHRATDRLRSGMRRPVLVVDEFLEEAAEAEAYVLPAALDTQLDELLRSLPEVLRVALVLRYGEEGLLPEEIAELLGQPIATVKSHLQRGLALLRRKAAVHLKEYVRDA